MIDPIDGSLNARRTIPSHSLSIAVASGPSMADVEFGFVHDFGADEEFVARRGAGAEVGGAPARVSDRRRASSKSSASSRPSRDWSLAALAALDGKAYRLRVVGSIAITAAYVGSGRFDAMLSLRPCRSVDAAAAQLFVREAGGAVAFGDLRPGRGPARPRRALPDGRGQRDRGPRGRPRRPVRLSLAKRTLFASVV